MKNVLVIGGSYFAGRVFVETLCRSDQYKIHVFNRGNIPIRIEGVEQIKGDREIPAHLERIPHRHWDAVIDFCAYAPTHINNMLHGIPGTLGHYVFISTTSIYAPTQHAPIAEDAPKVDGPQPELGEFAEYGYLKWLSECALEEECKKKDLPFTILRPAIIYGRYNYAPRESSLFDQVIAGTPLVIPENDQVFYSFVWVDDLANIIIACLENETVFGQAFNVAGEEQISYVVIADVLEEVCERKVERRVMTTDEIIRKRIPLPFPPDDHLLYDGSKMRHALGFSHTSFTIGMAKTWKYYQKVVQQRRKSQKKN
jgi:nucleoside-diphosphate-sugar epimerase